MIKRIKELVGRWLGSGNQSYLRETTLVIIPKSKPISRSLPKSSPEFNYSLKKTAEQLGFGEPIWEMTGQEETETQTESFKVNWTKVDEARKLLEQEKAFKELGVEIF